MNVSKIKRLIEILEKSGLSEIEIHEGEESIRISRYQNPSVLPQQLASLPTGVAAPVEESVAPAKSEQIEALKIKSPMVGVFYRAAAPGDKPFVEKGDTIKVGDTLCIIEAMKMLNQITADREGKVLDILVENGQPVEFGQALFIVE